MAAFGLAALFAWASSASAALTTTEDTTGPVGSVDDRAPAAPTNVKAEANLVDFQGELSWDLSADDFVRQSPAGDDFTSGGTFTNTNDVASYQIWRSALGDDYELIATVDGGESAYIDTGVESGVPYTYAVTAVDGSGNASASVESELVSFGPPGEATSELPPGVPEPVQELTMRFDNTLDLEDQAAVDDFKDDFTQLLVDLLGVDPDRIVITDVRSGSVIVDFTITEDPTLSTKEVVALLKDAVENDPQVFADAGLGSLLNFEQIAKTAIDFGAVEADGEGSETITYTNTSTDPDAILIVSASVSGAGGFSVFPERLSLGSGESGSLDVSFAAVDAGNFNGDYTGALTVVTNDPSNPLTVIALTAQITGGLSGPTADLSTTSIKFPRTSVGSTSTRTLTISNNGDQPLAVGVELSGDDAFAVSPDGALSIDAGESADIEVVFSPDDEASYTGTIHVTTDDIHHLSFDVALSGTGSPAGGPAALIGSDGQEIYGDFDGDASVTFDDFFQFADNFGLTSTSPNYDASFDLSGNGQVDFDDFFIFADNFGKSGTYASSGGSAAITFAAALDGSQESSDTGSAGSGFGDFSYTDEGGLTYEITVQDLSGPVTGAHIHNGALGVSGGVVHALTFAEGPAGTWTSSGTWDSSDGLTPELVDELKAGNLYVNVHTEGSPAGEIRGQIEE